MPHTVLVTAAAQKMLKKLPQTIRDHLVATSLTLSDTPLLGEPLSGELRAFRSLHTKLNNVHYRIAYEVHETRQEIMVRAVGVRENFYARLDTMKLKPSR